MDERSTVEAALELSYEPSAIAHREDEFKEIESFFRNRETTGGSLYVCGGPGTGKSLHVTRAAACVKPWMTRGTVHSNGLETCRALIEGIASPSIIKKYVKELSTQKEAIDLLEKEVLKPKRRHWSLKFVIIDEIDALLSIAPDLLAKLFELANTPDTGLCLCGIANAIDLPHTANLPLPQYTVVFQPYTFQALRSILEARCSDTTCFEASALEFCARRAAAQSGDARRALDVALKALRSTDAKVSVRDIRNAFNDANATPLLATIKSLPMHARLALRAAAKLAAEHSTFSKRQLISAYLTSCPSAARDDGGHDAIALLEASGLIHKPHSSLPQHKKRRKSSSSLDSFSLAIDIKNLNAAFDSIQSASSSSSSESPRVLKDHNSTTLTASRNYSLILEKSKRAPL